MNDHATSSSSSSSRTTTDGNNNGGSSERVAVLGRVRNRLVQTRDAQLPTILTKLLPRLWKNHDLDPPPNDCGDKKKNDDENHNHNQHNHAESHWMGMFQHLRDRILLNPTQLLLLSSQPDETTPPPTASSAANEDDSNQQQQEQQHWVDLLLDLLVSTCPFPHDDCHQNDDSSSSSNRVVWIRKHQGVLPIVELAVVHMSTNNSSNNNNNSDSQNRLTFYVSSLMQILESLQQALLLLSFQNKNNNNDHNTTTRTTEEEQEDDEEPTTRMEDADEPLSLSSPPSPPLSQPTATTIQMRNNIEQLWYQTSWILLECMAKAASSVNTTTTRKITAPSRIVLDWSLLEKEETSLVGCPTSSTTNTTSPRPRTNQCSSPITTSQEAVVAAAAGPAVFQFFMDVLAFDPQEESTHGHRRAQRWNFRRRHPSQQESEEMSLLVVAGGDSNPQPTTARTTTTTHVVNTTTLRGRGRSSSTNSSSWSSVELRYWNALQQSARWYGLDVVYSNPDTTKRAILQILSGGEPPANQSTLSLYQQLRLPPSQMKHVNLRRRKEPKQEQQPQPSIPNHHKTQTKKKKKNPAERDNHQNDATTNQLATYTILLHLVLGDLSVERIISSSSSSSLLSSEQWAAALELYYPILWGDNGGATRTKFSSSTAAAASMAIPPLPSRWKQRVLSQVLEQTDILEQALFHNDNDHDDPNHTRNEMLTIMINVFVEFVYQASRQWSIGTTAPPFSSELYEEIGARTPPSQVYLVRFFGKLLLQGRQRQRQRRQRSKPPPPPSLPRPDHPNQTNMNHNKDFIATGNDRPSHDDLDLPTVLMERAYQAAVDLIQPVLQQERPPRHRQPHRQRQRRDLLSEHRRKAAYRHSFVMDAIQARAEAYQIWTCMLTPDRLLRDDASSATTASNDDNKSTTAKNTVLSWTTALQILNAMAFDNHAMTQSALQQCTQHVIHCYAQVLSSSSAAARQEPQRNEDPHNDNNNRTVISIPSINPLLLPLLQACISVSEESREMVLLWATQVIFPVDPYITQTILACLARDENTRIAQKAKKALTSHSVPPKQEEEEGIRPEETNTIDYRSWDESYPCPNPSVQDDLQRRMAQFREMHPDLSSGTAYRVLQKSDFSVPAASRFLNQDLSSPSHVEVDQQGDAEAMVLDDPSPPSATKTTTMDENEEVTCQVCWDDIPLNDSFVLECSHRFCMDCWKAGIAAAATSSSFKELATFACLQHDCPELVAPQEMVQINPTCAPVIELASLKWFVKCSSDYSFCPTPDCKTVAHRERLGTSTHQPPSAECPSCSLVYCFDCGQEPHRPASCRVKQRYTISYERIHAHENAVEGKTIACPGGCGMGITKNGGCNHMTCTNCRHEFCWICLSPNWQDHVCNVYDSLNGVDDLQRIQFFRRRVDSHRQSADATRELLRDFDQISEEFQSQNPYCQDAHLYILKQAWKTALEGRVYLANSYIAAYGMPETVDVSFRRKFEAHQAQLQLFIEQLNLLSDRVQDLYEMSCEQDFRVRFRGLRFCTVAVAGYLQRMESETADKIN